MKSTTFALVLILLASASPGSDDTSPVSDGRVSLSSGTTALFQDDVPAFGTVLGQCSLEMSGAYAGAGITWRQKDSRFYLVDQGHRTRTAVWKLDPADPNGTLEEVPWEPEPIRGVSYTIPYSLAWDPDSSCFWVSVNVDGESIAGCYLLRYVWNQTRWSWAGTERDSWKIGDANNGGGLECLWLGGAEKNPNNGLFYSAPVASSPSVLNYVVRFDPYTKTNHGRVTYGDQTSERGCTVIPWDSSYILTCGWNANNYRKRDSTGYVLDQRSADHGPADWSLHIPANLCPDDTVCVYCINSDSQNIFQRISTGLLWRQLSSTVLRSVRPTGILAPAGIIDSGRVIVPALVIANQSEEPADDVDVHFTINDEADALVYHDSLTISLPPRAVDTVEFSAWIPVGRDSMAAIAWTYWIGDSVPEDDTLPQRFFVRVIDIAVEPPFNPVPHDTIDPGTVYASFVIANHGNVSPPSLLATVRIGPYCDTIRAINILPGSRRPITTTNPWSATAGTWLCTFNVPVPGDMHPGNNDTTYWFHVRGTIDHDVEVVQIDVPAGVIDTSPFSPRAQVKNNGTGGESFMVHFWMEDTVSDAVVYRDSVSVNLPGGLQTTAVFTQTQLTVEGPYVASCSAHLATDQDWRNNAKHVNFRVGPGIGCDVGVSAILSPVGTIDSGQVITPVCEVRNYGRYSADFPVYMMLPHGYAQMVDVSGLGVGATDTVTFPAWAWRLPPGTYDAVAWTLMSGDENPANDTCIEPFTVRRRDIGVFPPFFARDTIPPDTVVVPQCRVTNFGTTTATFDVTMIIRSWPNTQTVLGLSPGVTAVVDFDTFRFGGPPGMYIIVCYVQQNPPDQNPENDTAYDTLWVLPHAGVAGEAGKPRSFELHARPSQFTSSTTVRFGTPHSCNVDLAVFSASGRRVRTLVNGRRLCGWHSTTWRGRDDAGREVGPGVYYIRMSAGEFLASRKLVKLE